MNTKMQENNAALAAGTETLRIKFDALPTPSVSSAEVSAIKHGTGFVNRVVDWLIQKDVLGDYNNTDKGWSVTINRRSVREVVSHGAMDGKVALLERAPDLIENGIFLETTVKDGGYRKATAEELADKQILKSHIFAARAIVNGERSTIGIVVRDDHNGKRYYDHAIRVEESRGDEGPPTIEAATTPPNPQRTVSDIVQEYLGNQTP